MLGNSRCGFRELLNIERLLYYITKIITFTNYSILIHGRAQAYNNL